MRLYIEGYAAKKGWAINREFSEEEIRFQCDICPWPPMDYYKPIKWMDGREKALAFVARYNRIFATH